MEINDLYDSLKGLGIVVITIVIMLAMAFWAPHLLYVGVYVLFIGAIAVFVLIVPLCIAIGGNDE